jgi:hypothetical protein
MGGIDDAGVSIRQALADLGPVEALAESYSLALRGPKPARWVWGAVAAAAVIALHWLVVAFFAWGMMLGLNSAMLCTEPGSALAGVSDHFWIFGIDLQATFGPNGLWATAPVLNGQSWWAVGAYALAFAVVARPWRARRRSGGASGAVGSASVATEG